MQITTWPRKMKRWILLRDLWYSMMSELSRIVSGEALIIGKRHPTLARFSYQIHSSKDNMHHPVAALTKVVRVLWFCKTISAMGARWCIKKLASELNYKTKWKFLLVTGLYFMVSRLTMSTMLDLCICWPLSCAEFFFHWSSYLGQPGTLRLSIV